MRTVHTSMTSTFQCDRIFRTKLSRMFFFLFSFVIRALLLTVSFFVSFPLHVVLEERETAAEKLRSQMYQCYHFMRCNKIHTEMY